LSVLRIGSKWLDIDPRVAPRSDERIVLKKFTSAFHLTELEEILHAAGVDTVIVTGCTTSGCVRATAIDSTQRRFRTIIPREAVGDRAPGPHEANLFDLDSKWTDVIAVDEVLAYFDRIGAEQRDPGPA
jgi:nicotinamidase-related amidase